MIDTRNRPDPWVAVSAALATVNRYRVLYDIPPAGDKAALAAALADLHAWLERQS